MKTQNKYSLNKPTLKLRFNKYSSYYIKKRQQNELYNICNNRLYQRNIK